MSELSISNLLSVIRVSLARPMIKKLQEASLELSIRNPNFIHNNRIKTLMQTFV